MENKEYTNALETSLLMIALAPHLFLIHLYELVNKKPAKLLFACDSEYWYIKTATLEKCEDEIEDDKYKLQGALDAYKKATDIPFEEVIIKCKPKNNTPIFDIDFEDMDFISSKDSTVRSLELDWKSRSELDSLH